MGQQIISDEDHDYFGKLTNQFASEGSPIFLFGSIFSRTNRFCFENDCFLIHGLGKCEGVGEDSRHGDELNIQVGSCICLNVCLFWNIALQLGRE